MPGPVRIQRPDDPRLADYRDLTDTALRKRTEPEHGMFIAEGELVLQRALQGGHQVRSLLLLDARAPLLEPLVSQVVAEGAPVYLADADLLRALTGFHVHRGVLAAMARGPERTAAAIIAGPRSATRIAVLEDLASTTNLGAVLRSAAALGMNAALLSPGCGDPLYRRSVRVSMGEVFSLPWARLSPWPEALEQVRGAGFRLLALTPDASATSLDALSLRPDERIALLLGAEGAGLSSPALAAADEWVRIPMAATVDSLNVAAAAAVAFWATGRR